MIGTARNGKPTRVMVWVETNVIEMKTEHVVWRIVHHRNRNQYEVRFMDPGGRFRATDAPLFASLDEAKWEIEAREAAAHKDSELLRNQ